MTRRRTSPCSRNSRSPPRCTTGQRLKSCSSDDPHLRIEKSWPSISPVSRPIACLTVFTSLTSLSLRLRSAMLRPAAEQDIAEQEGLMRRRHWHQRGAFCRRQKTARMLGPTMVAMPQACARERPKASQNSVSKPTPPLSWSPRSCLKSSHTWTSPFVLGSGMDGPRCNAKQEWPPWRSARVSEADEPSTRNARPSTVAMWLQSQSQRRDSSLQIRIPWFVALPGLGQRMRSC